MVSAKTVTPWEAHSTSAAETIRDKTFVFFMFRLLSTGIGAG